MSSISKCCIENNIKLKKVEYLKNSIIIYSDDTKYLLKEGNNDLELFDYFEKVGFHNYLHRINKDNNDYSLYIYCDDINSDKDLKIKGLIDVISTLHLKTMYYTELSTNQFDQLYNNINKEIEYTRNYYLDLQDYIEEYPFPKIDHLFLIKNISMIYQILLLSKKKLDEWYNMKKLNLRKSYIIGDNNSLDNFRFCDNSYFINYNKCHEDIFIYDLVYLYKNEVLNVDFIEVFNLYKEKILLEDEEINLFKALICIPNKITFSKDMYENTIKINNLLDYISRTFSIVLEKNEENQEANE